VRADYTPPPPTPTRTPSPITPRAPGEFEDIDLPDGPSRLDLPE
jgi:hypothetical protein